MIDEKDRLPLFDGDFLRPYQRQGVTQTRRQFFVDNHDAVCLSMPTGAGKTTTCVALPNDGARCLVIAAQDLLVQQWRDTIRSLRHRASALEQGKEFADGDEEWICGTHQSLLRQDKKRGTFQYERLLGTRDLIVVDEADDYFSRRLRTMLSRFIESGAKVLGVTATPFAKGLFGFYQPGYCVELLDLFRQGWLVQPRLFTHRAASMNLDHVKASRVDFDPVELERMLLQDDVVEEVCSLISDNFTGQWGVVRCRGVLQARAMAKALTDRYGIEAAAVDATMPKEERDEILSRFRAGDLPMVTNCRVLGRGVDIPEIRQIFSCSPTKSRSTFMQALGRGNRALTGVLRSDMTEEERLAAIASSAKPSWEWHDIASQTSRHHSVVTAIQVLASGPDALVAKLDAKPRDQKKGTTLEELDEEMREEVERLRELEREAAREARERLKGARVGFRFDTTERSIFDAPDVKTPKAKRWHMPYGKFKGRPMSDPAIPSSYLRWMFENTSSIKWSQALKQEIHRREAKRTA